MMSQQDTLRLVYRLFSSDISSMSGINAEGSQLSSDQPLIIHDLSGAKLFFDYEIVDKSGDYYGFIRSSAAGKQMPLIDTICIGPRPFVAEQATIKALAAAKQRRPTAQLVDEPVFVCYGYPRVGVLVKYLFEGKNLNVIFDAAAGIFVREFEGQFTPEAGDEAEEGDPFYSYLGKIPEAGNDTGEILQQWQFYEEAEILNSNNSHGVSLFGVGWNSLSAIQDISNVRVAENGALLPVLLRGQNTPVFCAVATAQMMLEYIGMDETQEKIASALNTSNAGTTNEDFVSGFGVLTEGKWKASAVQGPTFDNVVSALGGMVPIKSGIPQHARLIRGWKEYTLLNPNGTVAHTERFFIVDDPWPVNMGQIALESCTKAIPDFYRNIVFIGVV